MDLNPWGDDSTSSSSLPSLSLAAGPVDRNEQDGSDELRKSWSQRQTTSRFGGEEDDAPAWSGSSMSYAASGQVGADQSDAGDSSWNATSGLSSSPTIGKSSAIEDSSSGWAVGEGTGETPTWSTSADAERDEASPSNTRRGHSPSSSEAGVKEDDNYGGFAGSMELPPALPRAAPQRDDDDWGETALPPSKWEEDLRAAPPPKWRRDSEDQGMPQTSFEENLDQDAWRPMGNRDTEEDEAEESDEKPFPQEEYNQLLILAQEVMKEAFQAEPATTPTLDSFLEDGGPVASLYAMLLAPGQYSTLPPFRRSALYPKLKAALQQPFDELSGKGEPDDEGGIAGLAQKAKNFEISKVDIWGNKTRVDAGDDEAGKKDMRAQATQAAGAIAAAAGAATSSATAAASAATSAATSRWSIFGRGGAAAAAKPAESAGRSSDEGRKVSGTEARTEGSGHSPSASVSSTNAGRFRWFGRKSEGSSSTVASPTASTSSAAAAAEPPKPPAEINADFGALENFDSTAYNSATSSAGLDDDAEELNGKGWSFWNRGPGPAGGRGEGKHRAVGGKGANPGEHDDSFAGLDEAFIKPVSPPIDNSDLFLPRGRSQSSVKAVLYSDDPAMNNGLRRNELSKTKVPGKVMVTPPLSRRRTPAAAAPPVQQQKPAADPFDIFNSSSQSSLHPGDGPKRPSSAPLLDPFDPLSGASSSDAVPLSQDMITRQISATSSPNTSSQGQAALPPPRAITPIMTAAKVVPPLMPPPGASASTGRSRSANAGGAVSPPLLVPPPGGRPRPAAQHKSSSSILDDLQDAFGSSASTAPSPEPTSSQGQTKTASASLVEDDFGDFETFSTTAQPQPAGNAQAGLSPKKPMGASKPMVLKKPSSNPALAAAMGGTAPRSGTALSQQDLSFFDSL